jgi:hypothetical protein
MGEKSGSIPLRSALVAMLLGSMLTVTGTANAGTTTLEAESMSLPSSQGSPSPTRPRAAGRGC